jgi:hypothetical protein
MFMTGHGRRLRALEDQAPRNQQEQVECDLSSLSPSDRRLAEQALADWSSQSADHAPADLHAFITALPLATMRAIARIPIP